MKSFKTVLVIRENNTQMVHFFSLGKYSSMSLERLTLVNVLFTSPSS